jgi:alkylresorcinol/alkylpyrone synthase
LISTGLFADGAAAVVGIGADRAGEGPRVVASQSAFYPDSERIMGWDVGASGFRIVLSAGVPAMVQDNLRPDVEAFLAAHDLRVDQVDRWICHPGGPKVIDALQAALHLDDQAVAHTWNSLKTVGNLSSASVLLILQDHLAERPQAGEIGVLMAMGPGFCAELVLLRW